MNNLRVLFNSYIRELDRIGVRGKVKSCAARPQEDRRRAISKINRTVILKIAMECSKRCNILAKREIERQAQSEEMSWDEKLLIIQTFPCTFPA